MTTLFFLNDGQDSAALPKEEKNNVLLQFVEQKIQEVHKKMLSGEENVANILLDLTSILQMLQKSNHPEIKSFLSDLLLHLRHWLAELDYQKAEDKKSEEEKQEREFYQNMEARFDPNKNTGTFASLTSEDVGECSSLLSDEEKEERRALDELIERLTNSLSLEEDEEEDKGQDLDKVIFNIETNHILEEEEEEEEVFISAPCAA
jgi:hypothetical protein